MVRKQGKMALTFSTMMAMGIALSAAPVAAQNHAVQATSARSPALTYADLVDLADGAPLVVRAQVRKQAVVEPERSTGLRAGFVRLYVEAQTVALITGATPLGESLRYLVDVPLDAKGKVPKLKKQEVLIFARPVAGRAGQIQLVKPTAQIAYDAATEAQLRPILEELLATDAPPAITRISDALSVEGNLAGKSETQLFIDTVTGNPVSLTITRRPGMAPFWGVSWTEVVDQSARPPAKNTLEWYRLACFLPAELPPGAILSHDSRSTMRVNADYGLVLRDLGQCERNRG